MGSVGLLEDANAVSSLRWLRMEVRKAQAELAELGWSDSNARHPSAGSEEERDPPPTMSKIKKKRKENSSLRSFNVQPERYGVNAQDAILE